MYKIEGIIKKIGAEQIVSEKFRKREIVLEIEDGKYSQFVKLEFVQNNCSFLEGFALGENVEILFNLKGREWIDKEGQAQYFNTIQGFGIKRIGQEERSSAPAPNKFDSKAFATSEANKMFSKDIERQYEPEDDDLPF